MLELLFNAVKIAQCDICRGLHRAEPLQGTELGAEIVWRNIQSRIQTHFDSLFISLFTDRQPDCVSSRQHLRTTRSSAERGFFIGWRAAQFGPRVAQIPCDAIQSLFFGELLNLGNHFSVFTEDLHLESRLIIRLVLQVISDQRAVWRIGSGKLLVAYSVPGETGREAEG